MSTVRIDRPIRRRRSPLSLGCGCFAVMALACMAFMLGAYIFWPVVLPQIIELAGVERLGSTDDLFDDPPPPTVEVRDAQPVPDQVTVNLGAWGSQSMDAREFNVVTGSTDQGARVLTASFTEDEMLEFCRRQSPICRDGNQQVRGIRFDLRPNGAIVYMSANTGAFWQQVGVVLQLDETRRRFRVVGVDVGGSTYAPNSLPLGLGDVVGTAINDIEREGNQALQQMALSAGGDQYALSEVLIDHDTITVVMR